MSERKTTENAMMCAIAFLEEILIHRIKEIEKNVDLQEIESIVQMLYTLKWRL